MIEEAEYRVVITLTNLIGFSPIERATRITQHDAIQNALGTMPDEVWKQLEGEGWTIESSAERL